MEETHVYISVRIGLAILDAPVPYNETNLMSAKLRELMLKHVYYVQRTDGVVRF